MRRLVAICIITKKEDRPINSLCLILKIQAALECGLFIYSPAEAMSEGLPLFGPFAVEYFLAFADHPGSDCYLFPHG